MKELYLPVGQPLMLMEMDTVGILLMDFRGVDNNGSCICSVSFEESTITQYTPNNWLVSPAINLTSNAVLTFYVSGSNHDFYQDNYSVYLSATGTDTSDFTTLLLTEMTTSDWALKNLDLSSFTGQTVHIAFRHHDTEVGWWIRIDNVTIFAQPTAPLIEVFPQQLEFDDVLIPGHATKTVEVCNYLLPDGSTISASTSSPFSLSADNVNFSNSVSMLTTDSIIFIRYTPTIEGVETGTVSLTCTSANPVTIPVVGHGRDCSNTPLPYEFHFDNIEQAYCWTMIDVNYDAHNLYGEIYFSLENGFAVYGFNDVNAADDWLISPAFTLGDRAAATFEYSATEDMSGYVAPEKYEVYAIVNGQPYNEGTLVVAPQECDNTEWLTQFVNLSAFARQSVQVAIHVISDPNAFVFGIQNFAIANNLVGVESREIQTSIFPNPANSNLHVSTSTPMNSVSLYNLAGQLLGRYDAEGLQTEINVSNLSSGMYLLKIETEKGVVNQKFNVSK